MNLRFWRRSKCQKIKIEMIPVSRDTESMLKYVGCTYETMPDGTEYWKWVQNFLWSDTMVVDRIEKEGKVLRTLLYILKYQGKSIVCL